MPRTLLIQQSLHHASTTRPQRSKTRTGRRRRGRTRRSRNRPGARRTDAGEKRRPSRTADARASPSASADQKRSARSSSAPKAVDHHQWFFGGTQLLGKLPQARLGRRPSFAGFRRQKDPSAESEDAPSISVASCSAVYAPERFDAAFYGLEAPGSAPAADF